MKILMNYKKNFKCEIYKSNNNTVKQWKNNNYIELILKYNR